MNAVSIPGSEELDVLSPSCIEIVQSERERGRERVLLNGEERIDQGCVIDDRYGTSPSEAGEAINSRFLSAFSLRPGPLRNFISLNPVGKRPTDEKSITLFPLLIRKTWLVIIVIINRISS
ncbi:hypothetical protein AVEN_222398-1 [Araneus ventricosus]|uniref:Uncharacterized protein n=1 Tax=Araneus ventricosus TaxID=182803 RepID=A0A4Y2N397_ARAVE|nr:hypothetical protein AVEN_222398-1 [Araneus ventricosus]